MFGVILPLIKLAGVALATKGMADAIGNKDWGSFALSAFGFGLGVSSLSGAASAATQSGMLAEQTAAFGAEGASMTNEALASGLSAPATTSGIELSSQIAGLGEDGINMTNEAIASGFEPGSFADDLYTQTADFGVGGIDMTKDALLNSSPVATQPAGLLESIGQGVTDLSESVSSFTGDMFGADFTLKDVFAWSKENPELVGIAAKLAGQYQLSQAEKERLRQENERRGRRAQAPLIR